MKTSYILCCLAVLFITIGCQHKAHLPSPIQGNDTTTVDSTDTVEKKSPVDTIVGIYSGNYHIKNIIDGVVVLDTTYQDTIIISKLTTDSFKVSGAVYNQEIAFRYNTKNQYSDGLTHAYRRLYIYKEQDSVFAEYGGGSGRAASYAEFYGKRP